MKTPARQRGAALVIGMIMLVLMMLLVITSVELGMGNTAMTGNMQFRNEAFAAANGAIEDALSTTRLFQAPDTVYLVPCTLANTKCVDVNADGTDDIVVALTPSPRCIQAVTVRNNQLNLTIPSQRACVLGSQQSFGIEGGVAGNSLCADTLWDINAVATDAVTQAQVRINSGAALRVSTDTVADSCI